MSTKKQPITNAFEHCNFSASNDANEHTVSAIEALADAAKANALAITAIANCLRSSPATTAPLIQIGK